MTLFPSTTRQSPRFVRPILRGYASRSIADSFLQPILDILAEMLAYDDTLKLDGLTSPTMDPELEAMIAASLSMPPTVAVD